jgi:hypothetical protein
MDNVKYHVYHKPQISLNHFWNINSNSNLSTAAYVSIGNGFGYSGQGFTTDNRSDWYGVSNGKPNPKFRTLDGTFDYGAIYALNKASETGSLMAMSQSVNQHRWYGLLSTYTTKITENISFFGGLDFRYYKGIHTNELVDLYGGNFFIDATSNRALLTSTDWKTQKLSVGDMVYRDFDGFVRNEGIYMQAEYNKDALSAFVSLSGSNTTYWRYDRYYYDEDKAMSEKISFLGYSAKGGANYNLTKNHNVFANIGVISRAPFFSGGGFLQSATSNITNPNAVNEKAFSTELGYGFVSTFLSANLNLYRTQWRDKTLVRATNVNSPESLVVNMEGVNALHQGIEIDFVAKPLPKLDISGMLSLGDWKWQNDASGFLYNRNGQPTDEQGNVVDVIGVSPHKEIVVEIGGVRVGNSAQSTAAFGVKYEILKGFKVGIDGNYFGRNYSYFSISSVATGSTVSGGKFSQPWMIPDATTFDFSLSYRFKMGGFDASIFGNVNNLLNTEYIADANDGTPLPDKPEWTAATVFYGFGRTFSTSLKIKF